MLLKYVAILGFIILPTQTLWALTAKQCADIQATYQIVPAQCTTAPFKVRNAPKPLSGHPTGATGESHIFFPNGGTRLDAYAQWQVTQIAAVLQTNMMRSSCVQLVGHSDASGDRGANEQIAKRRADAVYDALLPLLRNPSMLEEVLTEGELSPLPQVSKWSKWQRRVEIRARRC